MKTLALSASLSETQKARIEKTVQKEKRKLRDFIRKRVRNDEDANDILQDVFMQLAATIEPVEQMTAWLFRVARNRITDLYRKRKPESLDEVYSTGDDDDLRLHWEELIPSSHDSGKDWMREMLWTALMNALDELPGEQAEVFVKHELEGISFKALSEQTGTPLGTLLSRKRYAIQALRIKLAGFYEEMIDK